MIIELVYFGTILAFLLAIFGFLKLIPYSNILAAVMFITLAGLIGSFGIDIPTDQRETIEAHSVKIDANTTDTNTVQSLEIVYTNYGFSDPFVFMLVWVFLGLGITLAIFTFVY